MNIASVYVIAEAGVNHNGRRDLAFGLVDAAADAGADAVKFQTFEAARLAGRSAPKAAYQVETTGSGESQLEMLSKLELPRGWHADLREHARRRGIEFLSTAFDVDSLQFLVELDVPILKVPSGELTNGPLLWKIAHTGRPLIVSTGMASLSDVEQALAVISHALHSGTEPLSMEEVWCAWGRTDCRQRLAGHATLLHCTSQYPVEMHEVNLRAMDTLGEAFGLSVGYSDHTSDLLIPVAAVARGARVLEKHITLDRTLPGPDHRASLDPGGFAKMVRDVRAVEAALGDGRKVTQPSEWNTRLAAFQQVVAARPVAAGARLERADLGTARCGRGIPAMKLWELIGRTATRSFAAGDAIEF